mgnify:CR=1 FL=1
MCGRNINARTNCRIRLNGGSGARNQAAATPLSLPATENGQVPERGGREADGRSGREIRSTVAHVRSRHDTRHPLHDANIDLFIRTPPFPRNSGTLLTDRAAACDGGSRILAAGTRTLRRLRTTATIRLRTVTRFQTPTIHWNDAYQERRQSQQNGTTMSGRSIHTATLGSSPISISPQLRVVKPRSFPKREFVRSTSERAARHAGVIPNGIRAQGGR